MSKTVHEWRVWGEPGTLGPNTEERYPSYGFTYRDDDKRWPGEAAELTARLFIERMGDGSWEDGPHLAHRTVTYTDWEPA